MISEQPWSNDGESISHTDLWEEIRTTHKPSESPMGHVPVGTTETWHCVSMTRSAGSPPPSSNQHRDRSHRTRTLVSWSPRRICLYLSISRFIIKIPDTPLLVCVWRIDFSHRHVPLVLSFHNKTNTDTHTWVVSLNLSLSIHNEHWTWPSPDPPLRYNKNKLFYTVDFSILCQIEKNRDSLGRLTLENTWNYNQNDNVFTVSLEDIRQLTCGGLVQDLGDWLRWEPCQQGDRTGVPCHPGVRVPIYPNPVTTGDRVFFIFFIFFGGRYFLRKKRKKTLFTLCFFSLSLSLSLFFCTHSLGSF
jgi:hypothetical protein